MQTFTNEIVYKDHTSIMSQPDRQKPGNDWCALGLPHRDGDVVLRDGSTVHIRAMQPHDDQALFGLFQSLSEESRWLRFLSLAKGEALALAVNGGNGPFLNVCPTL